MITIEPICEDNFYEVITQTVFPEQEQFLVSNAVSLAECYLYRENNDIFPYAILHQTKVIGFVVLYEELEENDEYSMTIWRLMLDKSEQHKGYGKQAVHVIEDMISETNRYSMIFTNYHVNNQVSKQLFQQLGYQFDRYNDAGEEVVVKKLG